MLELVDSFHLGWNGFIPVQVQVLLPIYERNKITGSLLRHKYTEANRLKFGLLLQGKSYKRTKITTAPKILLSNETVMKLKLRLRGDPVCVYEFKIIFIVLNSYKR